MTSYPGGKNGSGVYQAIINQMPPHSVYVEGFLGSGAIMRAKRPAPVNNIGVDIDAEAIDAFDAMQHPASDLFVESAMDWIDDHKRTVCSRTDTMIYLDPPYLMSTRRQHRPIYRCELSDDDHRRLLKQISKLPCMVMISGYWSEMYASALAGWRTVSFQAVTRGGGVATEWLWMNYPQPFELHDYRFLGKDYRERERIKRKKTRWLGKLERMDPLERYAILDAINEKRGEYGRD